MNREAVVMALLKGLCFAVLMVLPTTGYAQRTFTHPGILHKQSDLDRMKYMVQSKVDWKDCTVAIAELKAGVQSMRIHITGSKKAFKLNEVTLTKI